MKISELAHVKLKGGYLPRIDDFNLDFTIISDEVEPVEGEFNGKPTHNFEWKVRLENYDKAKLKALKMFPAFKNKIDIVENGIGSEFTLSIPTTASKQLQELIEENPIEKSRFRYHRTYDEATKSYAYVFEINPMK